MSRNYLYILIGQLQLLFIYLKLTKTIDYNWFVVFIPLGIIPMLIILATMFSVSVYIYKKYFYKNNNKSNGS